MAFKDEEAVKLAVKKTETFYKKHSDIKDDLTKLITELKGEVGLKGAAQALIGQTIKASAPNGE